MHRGEGETGKAAWKKITNTLLIVLKGAAILPGPGSPAHRPRSRLEFITAKLGGGRGGLQGPSLYSRDWCQNALVQRTTYSEHAMGLHSFYGRRVY